MKDSAKDGEGCHKTMTDPSQNRDNARRPSTRHPPRARRRDHGNGLHIGEHTFVNSGCTFLDGADIFIGRHVLIGPNCQFYTPNHPMDYRLRRNDVETCHPIHVGDDSWLGGGVVVLPGVRIGARCVIGAGSVLTRDIPDDSLAVGNPARVVRSLARPCPPAPEA